MATKKAIHRPPSVHALVEHPALRELALHRGRAAVVQAAREVIATVRDELAAGGAVPTLETLSARVEAKLADMRLPHRAVINATGVLLHTNLGRAPLPEATRAAIDAAFGYCDLELDLESGVRASRLRDIETPLVALSGAEAATVVNNNAAAILLVLAALAGSRPTAVARGQLVEIGGGFRLPTILEASGSPLLEIGTTNRTHLADYEEAIGRGAGLLLVVHRSNFTMAGYVHEPEPEAIVELGRRHGVPVALDLGGGALLDTASYGLPSELAVTRAVAMGFDAVCFSGDKLVGGPQAGYIVGRRPAIEALRRHPLARAVRCDKLQLAAALATLEIYRRGEAERAIPVWRMLAAPTAALRGRVEAWHRALGLGEVTSCQDAVGGGALPETDLPGFALALDTAEPEALLRRLREGEPSVVGHIERDRILLHARTVAPEQDDAFVRALRAALETAKPQEAP